MHTEYNWFENPETGETPASFLELVETVLKPLNPEGVTNVKRESESKEYGAITFTFNGQNCLFRQAKTTPTKVEQFVTLWKRKTETSEIAPFDTLDGIELVFIASFDFTNKGFFIFPNDLLGKKAVFTHNGREGKRAMRVYAPWITPTVKQAISTQKWHTSVFINFKLGAELSLSKSRRLIQKNANLQLF